MIIYANLQSSQSISFRGEDLKEKKKSFCFWLPWQPEFCMDLPYLSNFIRGPSKDYLCEVLSKLA